MKRQLSQCVECSCALVKRNPTTARLVGLCPLLAVSNTVVKAITLGILLGVVMILSAGLTSALRYLVSWRLKPIYHVLIAAFATSATLSLVSIRYYELVTVLSIYPALLASNCLVLSAIQEIAERNPVALSVRVCVRDALGVLVIFSTIGAFRELAAYGSILTDTQLWRVGAVYMQQSLDGPVPLMASAAGAFLSLAALLAMSNALSQTARPIVPAYPAPSDVTVSANKVRD